MSIASPATISLITLGVLTLCLGSCTSMPFMESSDQEVVYALGERGNARSPLTAEMQPACPALKFNQGNYTTAEVHLRTLEKITAEWKEARDKRYLVAGYAPPSLPPDYARALSERRAHAIRQSLIEMGVEPANLQTAGFGNDFSLSSPTTDVVIIYRVE